MREICEPKTDSLPDRSAFSAGSRKKPSTHVHFETDLEGARAGFGPNDDMDQPFSFTNYRTFLRLVKSLLGAGILAMPRAFCHSGWFAGIVGSVLIALISAYCVQILLRSRREICMGLRVKSLTYGETAQRALLAGPRCCAKYARSFGFLVNFFLVVDHIGTCCIYIIFVASNLKEVVDQYARPMNVRIYVLLLLLPLPLLSYFRTFKCMVPFSAFANFITIIGFGITFYHAFSDLPSLDNRRVIGSIREIPLFIGMVLFSMEAIGVVLPLRNEMKNPKDFGEPRGTVNVATLLLTVSYVAVGFFGYIKYGDGTRGSITLNIPGEGGLVQSVKIMLSCSLFLSHALQRYVLIDNIWTENLWRKFFNRNGRKCALEYAMRTLAVLVTFVAAVLMPNLELLISLVGALCVTLLDVLFPAIVETATFWYATTGLGFYGMCAKNLLLALFGFSTFLVGVYCSAAEMVAANFP